jgi:hypothetical protein
VEAWFKKHRFVRFIKNTAGVAAVILIVFGGIFIFNNYDDIYNTYISDKIVYQEHTFDSTSTTFSEWDIDVTAENVSVKLIETSGSDFIISRNYVEKEGETYEVTLEGNDITVLHDAPLQINFWFNIDDLADLFVKDEIIIELPQGVLVEDVKIRTTNARVEINSLTADLLLVETSNAQIDVSGTVLDEMSLDSSNGSITIQDVIVSDSAIIDTSNAQVKVKYSEIEHIEVDTSNGKIILTNVLSDYMNLDTSNANVSIEGVTTTSSDATLIIDTSNGSVDLEDVYIHTVTIETTNGSIDFYNDDTSFDIDVTHSTSNGSYEGNVN